MKKLVFLISPGLVTRLGRKRKLLPKGVTARQPDPLCADWSDGGWKARSIR